MGQSFEIVDLLGTLAVLATSACGSYLGPALLVPGEGAKVLYGVSAGYRYVSDTEGLVLGGNAAAAPPEKEARKARAFGDLMLGYGYQPLPYRSHWGTELGGGPAMGILPDRGGYPFSVGWAAHIEFPYRVSGSLKPWEMNDRVIDYSTLSPALGITQLIPSGSAHNHEVSTTLVFALTYRLSTWLSVQP